MDLRSWFANPTYQFEVTIRGNDPNRDGQWYSTTVGYHGSRQEAVRDALDSTVIHPYEDIEIEVRLIKES